MQAALSCKLTDLQGHSASIHLCLAAGELLGSLAAQQGGWQRAPAPQQQQGSLRCSTWLKALTCVSIVPDGEPFGNPLYGSAPGSTPLRQSYDPDNNPVYSPQGEDVPARGSRALLLLPPPPAEQLPAPVAPSGAVPLLTSASLLSHMTASTWTG